MALERGVKIKESQADILQNLNSNGKLLQISTSTLLLEMNVLNKLIYKSKNTHSKEKFFKCLERIKKCLNKWKLMDLDKKILTMSKDVGETENLYEILNEIKLGGQLALKIIIFCQETVQYSLAYLSRGFFVTLHVTLLSLLSRMWVLEKDCWTNLVECYQLVRSLIKENYLDLNKFPESLTSWLSEDTNGIFDGKCVNDAFPLVGSNNPIINQFFSGEKNDSDALTIFEENKNEIDLGEPLEDMFYFEDKTRYSTPKRTNDKTVSDLKTNLTLKFDLERAVCKNVCENDLKRAVCKNFRENESFKMIEQNTNLEKMTKGRMSKNLHNTKSGCKLDELGKRKTPMLDELRISHNKPVATRVRKSLHRIENTFFIKKTPCRYTLRSLLATWDFVDCSTKKLYTLINCLNSALHLREVLPSERKLLLRIQHSLQRELRKRRLNRRKKDGKKIDRRKERSFRKTCTDGDKRELETRCQEKDEQKSSTRRKNGEDRVRSMDLKYSTFSKVTQKDEGSQSKKITRDEIDDIFSNLSM